MEPERHYTTPRTRRIGLVVTATLLVVVLAIVVWPSRPGQSDETPPDRGTERATERVRPNARAKPPPSREAVPTTAFRELTVPPDLLDDPLYRSGLVFIRGRLLDPDGKPAPGALVTATELQLVIDRRIGRRNKAHPGEESTAKSETDGSFRIGPLANLGSNPVILSVSHDRWQLPPALAVSFRHLRRGPDIEFGDIQLVASVAITGNVTFADGRPCARAEVSAVTSTPRSSPRRVGPICWPPSLVELDLTDQDVVDYSLVSTFWETNLTTSKTDSDGRFRLRGVLPGHLRISVRVYGRVLSQTTEHECPARAETDIGTIVMPSGDSIRCRVVDGDGDPVPGVPVYVGVRVPGSVHEMNDVRVGSLAGLTREDGTLVVHGCPRDKITLAARRAGESWSFLVDVPRTEEQVIRLAKGRDVLVHVTTKDREPISGATCTVMDVRSADFAGESPRLYVVPCDPWREEKPGVYRIHGLADGEYRLRVQHGSGLVGVEQYLTVGQDEENRALIELGPPSTLTILVVNESKQPVPNARVKIDEVTEGWTNHDGTIKVDVTGTPGVGVDVDHPAFESKFDVTTEFEQPFEVVLRRCHVWEGRVRVASGRPRFETWSLLADAGDLGLDWTQLDADGHFVVNLPAKQYKITKLRDGLSRELPFEIVGHADTSINEEDKRTPLQIRAEWTDTAPTARVHGFVNCDSTQSVSTISNTTQKPRETPSVKTDDGGRFDLGDVFGKSVSLKVEAVSRITTSTDTIWSGTLRTTPRTRFPLRLNIHSGTIRGRVLDEAGNHVPRAEVTAHGRVDLILDATGQRAEFAARTDESGAFALRLTPGVYRLDAHYQLRLAENLHVAPGGRLDDVELRLTKKMLVSGRVDLQSVGIGGGRVRIKLVGRTEKKTSVEKGAFRLGWVATGTYQATLLLGSTELPLGTVVVTEANAKGLVIHPAPELRAEMRRQAESKNLTVDSWLKSQGVEPVHR